MNGWYEGSPQGWFVCSNHNLAFYSEGGYYGGSGMYCTCPKDPRAKDAARANCDVAGSFPSERAARRWMLRLEVKQIEADTDAVLEAFP